MLFSPNNFINQEATFVVMSVDKLLFVLFKFLMNYSAHPIGLYAS